jgi:hypothetical protein
VAAHFTNITQPDEILTACTHIRNHWMRGVPVARMWFIYNVSAWAGRTDHYNDPKKLLTDLKLMLAFNGSASVFDKSKLGKSVDVRLDTPANIGWRLTLTNDPLVPTPNNSVKLVKMAGKNDLRSLKQYGTKELKFKQGVHIEAAYKVTCYRRRSIPEPMEECARP